jgi:hypothetical protein
MEEGNDREESNLSRTERKKVQNRINQRSFRK